MGVSRDAFNERSQLVLSILYSAQTLSQSRDLVSMPLSCLLQSLSSDVSSMLDGYDIHGTDVSNRDVSDREITGETPVSLDTVGLDTVGEAAR